MLAFTLGKPFRRRQKPARREIGGRGQWRKLIATTPARTARSINFLASSIPVPGPSTYKNIDILINDVFCADDPAAGIPWVGIARHGPQFRGSANVKALFQQFITTFPDIWWAESTTHPKITAVPRLYSNDNYRAPTVGVQTTLWGTHKSPWFQDVAIFSASFCN